MKWEHRSFELSLLAVFSAAVVWSAIDPHDRFTWILEVSPAIVGVCVLVLTSTKFRFSRLVYFFVLIHTLILLIGGHYTYAEVPLFNWLRDVFGLARNHYDRVGHFAQGFIPALIAREILIRCSPVKQGKWLNLYVVCICLSISACYELFEAGVSIVVGLTTGDNVDAFLGTQGDVWDTQWDMTMALIGANCALILLSRIHDQSIRKRS